MSKSCVGPVCTTIGTAGSDNLVGSKSSNDVICGLGSSDSLTGLDGDDILLCGAGKDTLLGGRGETAFGDIIRYTDAGAAVTVDLATNTVDGAATGDTITGFESAYGSRFDDVLSARLDGVRSLLTGNAGDDQLDTNDSDGSGGRRTSPPRRRGSRGSGAAG